MLVRALQSEEQPSLETDSTLRPPERLHTLFLIDLSFPGAPFAMVRDACEAIRMSLYGDGETTPPMTNRLVGIVTFDSALQYYNLSVRRELNPVTCGFYVS